jgi:hypothetical protein
MVTIFLRFLPIFGLKIGVFLKNLCYIKIFTKTSNSFGKKRHFFAKKWRKYF